MDLNAEFVKACKIKEQNTEEINRLKDYIESFRLKNDVLIDCLALYDKNDFISESIYEPEKIEQLKEIEVIANEPNIQIKHAISDSLAILDLGSSTGRFETFRNKQIYLPSGYLAFRLYKTHNFSIYKSKNMIYTCETALINGNIDFAIKTEDDQIFTGVNGWKQFTNLFQNLEYESIIDFFGIFEDSVQSLILENIQSDKA